MAATYVVYVDESGDEGFAFNTGSSEWFVLSAVITLRTTDLATVKLVDEVRSILEWPPKKPLHFRKLKHHQRVPFINLIASAHLKTISILVHKPSIKDPSRFQERYRLYFYAARLLFERVSWYCRDLTPPPAEGDGSAEIIFSNRAGMSYRELCDYIDHLKANSEQFSVAIDWAVIDSTKIVAFTPGRQMGLQIADAVASGLFYAVERRYGYTEERYVCMLKPAIYNRRSNYISYGLKFWPPEVLPLLRSEACYEWAKREFNLK